DFVHDRTFRKTYLARFRRCRVHEVSGVRNSWVTESSTAERRRSLSRAASALVSFSTVLDRSIAIAARLPIASKLSLLPCRGTFYNCDGRLWGGGTLIFAHRREIQPVRSIRHEHHEHSANQHRPARMHSQAGGN